MRLAVVLLACLAALTGCGGGGGTGIVPTPNAAPTAVSAVSPSPVATGAWFTCTCTYADADGAADVKDCKFGITPTSNRVSFKYDHSQNRLYAFSSDTYTWAPVGGIQPGDNVTIESADAILDCENTTIATNATDVTVDFRIQLKPAVVADTYTLSLSATDVRGLTTGVTWVDFGQIVVQ